MKAMLRNPFLFIKMTALCVIFTAAAKAGDYNPTINWGYLPNGATSSPSHLTPGWNNGAAANAYDMDGDLSFVTVQYSLDGGSSWTTLDYVGGLYSYSGGTSANAIYVSYGDVVLFRAWAQDTDGNMTAIIYSALYYTT